MTVEKHLVGNSMNLAFMLDLAVDFKDRLNKDQPITSQVRTWECEVQPIKTLLEDYQISNSEQILN